MHFWCLWPQSFEGSGSSLPPGTLSPPRKERAVRVWIRPGSRTLLLELSPFASPFRVLRARELTTHAWYGYTSIDARQNCCYPSWLAILIPWKYIMRHTSILSTRSSNAEAQSIGRMNDVSIILELPCRVSPHQPHFLHALDHDFWHFPPARIDAKLCGSS